MRCNVIATGSTGNAVLLNDFVLVDCGVPFRKIEPYYRDIKLVILTHIHSDHFNIGCIKLLHTMRPAVRFICPPWMGEALLRIGISPRQVDVVYPSTIIDYGRVSASWESIPHDVDNCAWAIDIDGETAFYATDCGSLDGINAHSCDLYLVEANYVTDELKERQAAKISAGEFAYEARVEATHLSKEQAEKWVYEQAGPNSKVIYLHQHNAKKKADPDTGEVIGNIE